jgi:hypothetical protein
MDMDFEKLNKENLENLKICLSPTVLAGLEETKGKGFGKSFTKIASNIEKIIKSKFFRIFTKFLPVQEDVFKGQWISNKKVANSIGKSIEKISNDFAEIKKEEDKSGHELVIGNFINEVEKVQDVCNLLENSMSKKEEKGRVEVLQTHLTGLKKKLENALEDLKEKVQLTQGSPAYTEPSGAGDTAKKSEIEKVPPKVLPDSRSKEQIADALKKSEENAKVSVEELHKEIEGFNESTKGETKLSELSPKQKVEAQKVIEEKEKPAEFYGWLNDIIAKLNERLDKLDNASQ